MQKAQILIHVAHVSVCLELLSKSKKTLARYSIMQVGECCSLYRFF